jgi:outer membrane protein assembly factor BamB
VSGSLPAMSLAKALGPDFLVRGKEIVHQPTKTKMVLVPGGTFTMGYTVDDIRSVWLAAEEHGAIAGYIERSRPAHVVTLPPFLLARELAVGEEAAVKGKVALAAAKKAGLRLPSEAEWEWMAREGGRVRFTGVPAKAHPLRAGRAEGKWKSGPNGFGIGDLLEGEFVADALHDTYVGAPADGSAWGEKAEIARWGHIWWQVDIEVCSLHAAIRNGQKGEPSRYRFAASIPGATRPKPKAIDLRAGMKETLAGLVSKDPLPSVHTVETLLAITIHDDTLALLAALPPVLAKMKAGKDEALAVLAAAAERSPAIATLLAKYKLPTTVTSARPTAIGALAPGAAPESAMDARTADRRNCAEGVRGPVKGKLRWKYRVGKEITGPVIGADGTLYVGVVDGRLCAVSPKKRKTIWSFRGSGAVVAAPAVAPDGRIWFGTTEGKLYGIPRSGDAAGKLELTLKHPITTAPAVAPDGTLYVTTQQGPLFAIRDGGVAWQLAIECIDVAPALAGDGSGVVYFCDRQAAHAVTPAGKPLWKRRVDRSLALIVGRGGVVYVVGDDDVIALDPKKGKPIWSIARAKIDKNMWGSCGGLSQDAKGSLYLSSTSSDACVHVLAEKSGRRTRKLQANNWIHAPATLDAKDNAFFGSLMNMYAFGANGKCLWSAPLAGQLNGPLALARDGTLYGGTDRGVLHAFA